MPISTRKANVNAHPSYIILETQQSRHTKKQVEEDTSWAREAAIAEREENEANCCTVLATIADMEDTIEQSEFPLHNHTTRPNLHLDCEHSRNK